MSSAANKWVLILEDYVPYEGSNLIGVFPVGAQGLKVATAHAAAYAKCPIEWVLSPDRTSKGAPIIFREVELRFSYLHLYAMKIIRRLPQ